MKIFLLIFFFLNIYISEPYQPIVNVSYTGVSEIVSVSYNGVSQEGNGSYNGVSQIVNVSYTGVSQIGNTVKIRCLVNSSLQSTIEWYSDSLLHTCKNSKNFYTNSLIPCEYTIENYRNKNNFTCILINAGGNSSKSLIIDVLEPPVIIQSKSEFQGIKCIITHGNPLPFIYWEQEILKCKNCKSQWVSLSSRKVEISVNKPASSSTINFSDSLKDLGRLRCSAYNFLGNSSAEIIFPSVKDRSMIIGMVCGFLVIIFFFLLIIFLYKRYMTKKFALFMEPNPNFKFDPDRTLFEQSIELPYDLSWEFPRHRLDLEHVIGTGAFAQVWLANAYGISSLCPRDKSLIAAHQRTKLFSKKKASKYLSKLFTNGSMCEQGTFVAVKTLKPLPSDVEYKDLASEIKILIHLGEHPNIVNLLGACTKDGNLCAIMEYCPHGNLVGFLRPRRHVFSLQWRKQAVNYDEDFCWFDAANAAFQIANGMLFLSKKKLVHRDLAARNVLVGPDYVMKVADFGLSRDIYSSDVYVKESSGMLPVKWMAPESLFDKIYTIKSDVWSFGILLWEICTMGGSPYPGLPTEDLIGYLTAGKRMPKPDTCPNELYEIMVQCWRERLEERPWFHEIASQLQRIVESKMQVDNLTAFDNIQSVSDETDCLVPSSPLKDIISSDFTYAKNDKMSETNIDCVFSFPPIEDKNNICNEEEQLGSIGYIQLCSHILESVTIDLETNSL